MKEQFRFKKFGSKIKIKLSDGRLWEQNTHYVIKKSMDLVEEYQNMKIKLTLRQLYYQLVANDVIPNDLKVYQKLSRLITDSKYLGLIDWEAIEDRSRIPVFSSEWDNVSDLVETAIRSYRLPRMSDQDNYIELLTEKDALSSVLEPIARKWHIPYCVNRGYTSSTTMYNMYKRISNVIQDKTVHILYLGDHDPSGLDMNRDISERLGEFLKMSLCLSKKFEPNEAIELINDNFVFHHIALTKRQIKNYEPPPNPAKIKDPRAKWYISKYGKESWEVDALKPEIMIKIVDDSIRDLVDIKKYNAWKKKEDIHKELLKEKAKGI